MHLPDHPKGFVDVDDIVEPPDFGFEQHRVMRADQLFGRVLQRYRSLAVQEESEKPRRQVLQTLLLLGSGYGMVGAELLGLADGAYGLL